MLQENHEKGTDEYLEPFEKLSESPSGSCFLCENHASTGTATFMALESRGKCYKIVAPTYHQDCVPQSTKNNDLVLPFCLTSMAGLVSWPSLKIWNKYGGFYVKQFTSL